MTVANTGASAAGTYTLTDTPGFAPGLTFVTNGTTVTPSGGGVLDLNVSPYTPQNGTPKLYASGPLGSGLGIAIGATRQYQVAMQFTTSAGATNLTCTDQPSNGLFNRVDISGSTTANANACIPGPGAPNVTITKTDPKLSGPVGGVYTVTYTVTVANTGASAAGTYTLTDTPGFAPGLTFVANGTTVTPSGGGVLDAGVSPYTPQNGTPKLYASGPLGSGLGIAIGATHQYRCRCSSRPAPGRPT